MHISVQKIGIINFPYDFEQLNIIREHSRSEKGLVISVCFDSVSLYLTHSGTFFTIYHHHKPVQIASSPHRIFLLSSNCPSAGREDSLSNLNK